MQSVEEDRGLGLKVSKMVAQEFGTITDTVALRAWVKQVGDRLVKALADRQFEYSFQIVDMAEPNAFAAPGGPIYISRGLLALVNTEDELAGVMAHEIIHVHKRHTAQQIANQNRGSLLTLPGKAIGYVVDQNLGRLINAPLERTRALFFAGYSRRHELESDTLGMRLASSAGYDPKALKDLLKRMQVNIEADTGQKQRPSFFDSHPSTPTRIKNIQELADLIQWQARPGLTASPAEALGKLNGLLIGPNPTQGVVIDGVLLHPTMDVQLKFPPEWSAFQASGFNGAFSKDQKGIMILAGSVDSTSHENEAKKTVEQMRKDHQIEPKSVRQVMVAHHPATVVAYWQGHASDPVMLKLLWIQRGTKVQRLFGIGQQAHQASIKAAVKS